MKRNLFSLAVLLLSLSRIMAQNICSNDTFVQTTSLPTASGYRTVKYGTDIYAFSAVQQYKFNTLTETWSSITQMPSPRGDVGAAEVNGVIYCMGGYTGSWSNKNEAYDISSNTWTVKANLPTSISGCYAVSLNNKIYVMGGTSGITSTYFYEYDPATNSYTTLASPAQARMHTNLVAYNNKIYLVGGYYYNGTYNTSNLLDEYDPTTNSWTSKANLPTNHFNGGVTIYDNKLYFFGGANTAPSWTPLNTLYVYDFANDSWSVQGNMPYSVAYAGAETVNNVVYLIGGHITATVKTNHCYKYYCQNNSTSCLPNYVPTNGLVGFWPFCGNANDESGNGNNGTVNGATLTTDRNGNANSSYNFNGIDNYIAVPNVAVQGANERSFSAWIYTYYNPIWWTGEIIIATGSGVNQQSATFNLRLDNQSKYLGFMGFVNDYYPNGNIIVNDTSWHHVALTYKQGSLKFYVDGVLEKSTIISGLNTNGQSNFFGKSNDANQSNAAYYIGKLDDIAIYNRALTEQEITALYTGTNCVPPVATITPAGATTFCSGDSVILNANTDTSYSYQWQLNGLNITGATNSTYAATASGSYSVIISNAANCADTSAVTLVAVNALPLATITPAGATTFCAGGSVVLNANTGSGLSYQWKKNNSSISGATTASYTATTQGSYVVVVTGSNACSAISSVTTVTVNPLPTVTLTNLPAYVNIQASNIALNGNPTGGTYTGAGVVGTNFSASAAGLGTSNVTYNYTNASGCSGAASQSTLVFDTTGVVCNSYDTITTNVTIFDTTHVTVYDTTTTNVTIYDTVTTYLSVTDTLIINQTITGLVAPNNTNTIRIFPNPANDYVTINYGNYALMSGYSLNITNALGQLVFTTPINLASSYLDISTWGGNGTYFVNIINPQGVNVNTRKIVLQ